MKILTGIDIPFDPFGGSPIICNDWYSNLPDDIQVKFLTLKPTSKENTWWDMKDVHFLNVIKTKSPQEYNKYIAELEKEVVKVIKTYKPDVIHVQHLNFGLSRVFAQIPDIPKLGICHGTDVQWANKNTFFKNNLIEIVDRLDLLLFPAKQMHVDFKKVYIKEKPYVLNPHGIPDSYYKKSADKPAYKANKPLKVLYAGRLLHLKGCHLIVEAMKHTKYPINLTIVGREDEVGYKDRLKNISKEVKNGKVTYHNQLPRAELIASFDKHDLMVFPSVAVEAFSLTTIEAQSQGLPIAYAPSGGITDAVSNSGIMVKPNTSKEWARLFDKIHKNPNILNKYQTLGNDNANKHRLSKVRGNMFEITKELINNYKSKVL